MNVPQSDAYIYHPYLTKRKRMCIDLQQRRRLRTILATLILMTGFSASVANAQTMRPTTTASSRATQSLTATDVAGLFKLATATVTGGEDSLEELGKLQARLGDFAGAEATAKKIKGFGLARVTGRVVAYRAARQGVTAAAELRRLGLGAGDESVLVEVVLTLAEEGHLRDARAVAQMLPQGIYAADAWLIVARASKQKADFDRAMSSFRGAPDSSNLGQVVEARAACGDVTGALKQVEAEKEAHWRAGALWRIARVQVQAGDIEGAKATAERIDAKEFMLDADQAWACIAAALAAKGDVAGTKAAVERVQWSLRKPRITSALAYAQVKAGDLIGAKKTAVGLAAKKGENEPRAACFAFGTIASALAEKGNAEEARAILGEAEKLAAASRSPGDKVEGILLALKGASIGPRAVETEGYLNAE
jgi:tetratricopeptide (TPR) repeat protein